MLELLDLSFIIFVSMIARSATSTTERNSCSYPCNDIFDLFEALLDCFISSSGTPKLFLMSLFSDKPFDFQNLLLKLLKVYLLVIQLTLETLLKLNLIRDLLLLVVLHALFELCTLELSFVDFVFKHDSMMLLLANLIVERLNFFQNTLHGCQRHV